MNKKRRRNEEERRRTNKNESARTVLYLAGTYSSWTNENETQSSSSAYIVYCQERKKGTYCNQT